MRPAQLTVVIPVFNKAAHLEACLESVLSQADTDLDVVCVDDGSTDGSWQLLDGFARRDNRILLIRNERNLGPGGARNTGLRAATGAWVQFVDADDIAAPDAYSTLIRQAAASIDAVRGMVETFAITPGDQSRVVNPIVDHTGIRPLDHKEFWTPWWQQCFLFSREFLLTHGIQFPDLTVGEDAVFLATVLAKARLVSSVGRVTYFHRERPLTAKSRNSCKHAEDYVEHASQVKDLWMAVKPESWMEGYRRPIEDDMLAFIDLCDCQPEARAQLIEDVRIVCAGPEGLAEVDIVIPIHNAATELEACIASVASRTRRPFRLIAIDDGSTDPGIGHILQALSETSAIVIRRVQRRGFTTTVNEGLALSSAPYVVLLNSDTVVTDGWLDGLIAAAESRPAVATVTPLTNNGTVCSVPDLNAPGELPAGLDPQSMAALVKARSHRRFPETPTGVGFCMLVTRIALDTIGAFDAATFGEGYGEENDFCQRAIQAGFVNLVDDNSFVYHAGRASFGGSAENRIATNLEVIRGRFPNYSTDVARFYAEDPLGAFRADLRRQIWTEATDSRTGLTRILHVLHQGGGTETHVRDLARQPDPDFINYVSTSDAVRLQIEEYWQGERTRTWLFPFERPLLPSGELTNEGYRQAMLAACVALGVDLIHAHHLINNTTDLADVASALRIKYVVTLHDYYFLCPSYTLLNPASEPCGACIGRASPESAGPCLRHAGHEPGYLQTHQDAMESFLSDATCVFAPHDRVREVFAEHLPWLQERILIVPHGHEWTDTQQADKPPEPQPLVDSATLNIAVIGGLEPHKGLSAFKRLLHANSEARFVFHLYGWTPDADLRSQIGQPHRVGGSTMVYHGPYEASDIVSRMRRDGIQIGLLLAVWEETFSFALSEFVAAGTPVVAGNLGAQGERVRRCRLGWTVESTANSEEILTILRRVVAEPALLRDVSQAMRRNEALPGLRDMWHTYAEHYRLATKFEESAVNNARRRTIRPSPEYVEFLARRGQTPEHDSRLINALTIAREENAALRERLQSPRHRLADTAANFLHRIPILWPLVAKVTDALIRRNRTKRNT
ncbi:MAG TPA: glycosyltransferase [Vicinamibacterales bacterium]|nr:glycosyltransferase [Vicinamibacterales bacterium]